MNSAISIKRYQQIVINLLPYRIMNSELNSSVVQESFEFSDSDTIISSSSISLPVKTKHRNEIIKHNYIGAYETNLLVWYFDSMTTCYNCDV